MLFIITIVIILSLWSISMRLDSLAKKIMEKQDEQTRLLKEILERDDDSPNRHF